MRKKIVAGNWKMNKSFQDAEDLVSTIADELDGVDTACEVVLCPPYPYLEMASDYADESGLQIAAQNVSEFEDGAYTGEVSASMLASIEIGYCIVGHSERRKYFGETNAQLATKVEKLLDHAIRPIFCIGELLEERNANIHFEVVKRQLEEGLFQLNKDEFKEVVIAYEPVWAIGTGVTATSAQAQEMHAFIRQQIAGKYGQPVADKTTILYGGSCNAKNAAELFANPDVDGGLIGGASLVAEDFIKIVKSF
ncbi:MAG: triose-phosphate isomerase [Bacteroidetes bacterium HGW-Bacteroidetes-16]|jgi:triosephosphate isomerase|nr:MAG: triose-phosphate isomerase [Bacteroidetes bacterium HGW-Bacteroidetes-16]